MDEVLVVPGAHARLRNIDEAGLFIEDEDEDAVGCLQAYEGCCGMR